MGDDGTGSHLIISFNKLILKGNEIRQLVIAAFKGKEGACIERNQALIYKGPWCEVRDDDGHIFPRGKRIAVCDKTFNIMQQSPYKDQFIYIHPYIEIPLEHAEAFPCDAKIYLRDPKSTKLGLIPLQDDSACCTSGDASRC